jgi:aspartyl-tRNA synthetase
MEHRIYTSEAVEKKGEKVKLAGWIHSRRLHGKIIFMDLRDKKGLIQLTFLPENENLYNLANTIRDEWVVEVTGTVNDRPGNTKNENLITGEIEITVETLTVLNEAKTPPFEINSDTKVNEEVRLKYRYLDIRKPRMKRNLFIRHKIIKLIRDYMDLNDFTEIETPILTKSTPEGARDFLVPSRLHPGLFYALPQAPQQLKQLLMVAGVEKYFQLARCFRDEDLRGDRQPEFTQFDVEMSFAKPEDIMILIETLYLRIIQDLIVYDKSLSKKLTFSPFKVMDYKEAMDKYETDKPDLRKNPKDPNELAFVWIVNWPLFEWNKDENRYDCCHHIFTSPRDEDLELLDKDPLKAHSLQYDLVLNGQEIGGGSIRNHRREVQEKIFKLVGLNDEEIEEKFGHMLKAFEYGAPPHGGIAMGIDRLLATILNEESIRDVIAFPKTGDGRDLTMEAPGSVSAEQLNELNIKISS